MQQELDIKKMTVEELEQLGWKISEEHRYFYTQMQQAENNLAVIRQEIMSRAPQKQAEELEDSES